MQIPIDQIDTNKLVELLHNQEWQKNTEIIPDYIPQGHKGKKDEQEHAFIAVRYNDGSEHPPFLRVMPESGTFAAPNARIINGLFWDIYGHHFESIEEAIVAIAKAPKPHSVAPQTFSLNI